MERGDGNDADDESGDDADVEAEDDANDDQDDEGDHETQDQGPESGHGTAQAQSHPPTGFAAAMQGKRMEHARDEEARVAASRQRVGDDIAMHDS